MKAIVIHKHGGIDKLRYEEVATPQPGSGEVLIRVMSAGVNHFDHDIREGLSGITHQMPHVLGLEAAGEVVETGRGVIEFKNGDRVAPTFMLSDGVCRNCLAGRDNLCSAGGIIGVTAWGGYAEYIKAPAHNLIRLPDGLSYADAAASLVTMGTVWQMLISLARVQPGEEVLINGAGSGIGTAAIQIAKLAGARVIASAGSRPKLDGARTLGADEVIDYTKQDITSEVFALTEGRGVAAVIESIGGKVLTQSIACLSPGGRLITCGAHAGERVEIDVIEFFRKQISMQGAHGASKAEISMVFDLIARGRLKPVIHHVFRLEKASEAHEWIDNRKAIGKLLLTPQA